jgi:hypothetical protein
VKNTVFVRSANLDLPRQGLALFLNGVGFRKCFGKVQVEASCIEKSGVRRLIFVTTFPHVRTYFNSELYSPPPRSGGGGAF